jgi:hypothetical protein
LLEISNKNAKIFPVLASVIKIVYSSFKNKGLWISADAIYGTPLKP